MSKKTGKRAGRKRNKPFRTAGKPDRKPDRRDTSPSPNSHEAPVGRPRSPTNHPASAWIPALILFGFAWILRVAFVYSTQDRSWPFTVFYEGDSQPYFLYARAILDGQVYDQGVPFHPPGFAWFLAAAHQLLGAGSGVREIPHLHVKILLAGVASLAIAGLFILAKPYLGSRRAFAAAMLAAAHFGLIVLGIAPVTEGLSMTLTIAVLLVWSRSFPHRWTAPGRRRPSPRWLHPVLLGALAGVATLTRAEAIGWIGLLLLLGLATSRPTPREDAQALGRFSRARPWAVAASILVAVLTPWTLSNQHALSDLNEELSSQLAEPLPTFVPLTIYGPLNLALANHPDADGTFSRASLPEGHRPGILDLTHPDHLRLVLHGDRIAFDWLRAHPLDFVRLVARKWSLAFGGALSLGFGQDDWPAGLSGTRRPVDLFVPDRSGLVWILGPLTLLGAVIAWREGGGARAWLEIVLLLTLVRAATVAFFFGYTRQGALLLPFWFTLVVVALAAIGRAVLRRLPPDLVQRARGPGALLAGIALVVFLVGEIRGASANRTLQATGTTLPGSSKLNPDLAVRLEPLEP